MNANLISFPVDERSLVKVNDLSIGDRFWSREGNLYRVEGWHVVPGEQGVVARNIGLEGTFQTSIFDPEARVERAE